MAKSKSELDDESEMDDDRRTALDSVTTAVEAVSLQPGRAPSAVEVMLDRVAGSSAHFRHQQRGEPDLTRAEKLGIATDMFTSKPAAFLARFGKQLAECDLPVFDAMKGDYVIDFHLNEIAKYLNDGKNSLTTRNRRFEAMKKLVQEGEYFGEDEMKERNPLQYEQMIGKYLTDDEIAIRVDRSDDSFSNLLLNQIQMQQLKCVYDVQQDIENSQMEEEDEESDEDITHDEDGDEKRPVLCEKEKEALRNEFLQNMQIRFLNGEDAGFNYSDVDHNSEFDSIAIREQDEEEKYFDSEEKYFDSEQRLSSTLDNTSGQMQDIRIDEASSKTVEEMRDIQVADGSGYEELDVKVVNAREEHETMTDPGDEN